MTQYFDSKIQALTRMKEGQDDPSTTLIEKIDSEVVFDVSVCSEIPGFPDHLAERVNTTVIKYSAACQLVPPASGPGYETPNDYLRGITCMVNDLHTIFHDLVEWCVGAHMPGFSDDPRTPLRIFYSRAEEKREAMARL